MKKASDMECSQICNTTLMLPNMDGVVAVASRKASGTIKYASSARDALVGRVGFAISGPRLVGCVGWQAYMCMHVEGPLRLCWWVAEESTTRWAQPSPARTPEKKLSVPTGSA